MSKPRPLRRTAVVRGRFAVHLEGPVNARFAVMLITHDNRVVFRSKPLPNDRVGGIAGAYFTALELLQVIEHSLAVMSLEATDDHKVMRRYVTKLMQEALKNPME